MKSLKQLEDEWAYDDAVNRLIPMVTNWKKKTLEVARELYIANKKLSNSGYRSDLKELTSAKSGQGSGALTSCKSAQGLEATNDLTCVSADTGSPHSFLEFCESIGIPYSTAKSWLVLYDPDKDYLLTTEEYKDERTKELDSFYESVRKKREKIAGYIPEAKDINLKWNRNITSWTDTMEGKFQAWLVDKGYEDLDPSKLLPAAPASEDYDEFGLFGFEYLDSLAKKCTKKVSGEGAKEYLNMTKEYGPRIPKGVDTRNILRIPVIVEAEFDDLDTFQRKETAKVLSEIILKLGLEEKK